MKFDLITTNYCLKTQVLQDGSTIFIVDNIKNNFITNKVYLNSYLKEYFLFQKSDKKNETII